MMPRSRPLENTINFEHTSAHTVLSNRKNVFGSPEKSKEKSITCRLLEVINVPWLATFCVFRVYALEKKEQLQSACRLERIDSE